MGNLIDKKCVPCEGGVSPLSSKEIEKFMPQVEGWNLEEKDEHKQIFKKIKFKNFKEAMEFVNKVAGIAEEEGHHPNIFISYNRVRLTNYTHAIGGLHENDFILAAKIDESKKD